MDQDLIMDSVSHAWTPFTIATGAPILRFVISATPTLQDLMWMDSVQTAFSDGQRLKTKPMPTANAKVL